MNHLKSKNENDGESQITCQTDFITKYITKLLNCLKSVDKDIYEKKICKLIGLG